MNNKLLTTLGCSGSIALSLLTANAAQANPAEYVFTAPPEIDSEVAEIPASDTHYPFYECECDGSNAAAIEQSDRQGDKAIALYGCDCAGCRNLVQNLEPNEQSVSQNNS